MLCIRDKVTEGMLIAFLRFRDYTDTEHRHSSSLDALPHCLPVFQNYDVTPELAGLLPFAL